MKLRDLMTTDVITVGAEASLKEAARRMIEAGISGLPVTDNDGTLMGVVTEADFVKTESGRRAPRRAGLLRWFNLGEELPEVERSVGDVMTTDVITLGPDEDHAEAARVMQRKAVKRIPIVEEGRITGVVSRSDILRAFARPDAEILSEIRDDLIRDILWIDDSHLRLSCVDGHVTLAGNVETRVDAQLLVAMTSRIDGVASVANHITWSVDNTRQQMYSAPTAMRPNW